jgi:sulfide dehydrogenase cytochrome subunit
MGWRPIVVAAAAALAAAAAQAADMPAAAASCSGCHATSGKAASAVPPLAGRDPQEIAGLMRAFRTGERPATVMDRIAKGYSDAEIAALAAWFGAQR